MRFELRSLVVSIVIVSQSVASPPLRAACSIKIEAPVPDSAVGETTEASGSATDIGAGNRLWLFVHRSDIGVWWPQGGRSVGVDNSGKWKVTATIGLTRDFGHKFEISVRLFGDAENKVLEQYVQQTAKTGQYLGIPMPKWSSICEPATVVVTRRIE
jgi:hypothetical protein